MHVMPSERVKPVVDEIRALLEREVHPLEPTFLGRPFRELLPKLAKHGKSLAVRHEGTGLFAALPSPFSATRYHSLATGVLPDNLAATAWSDNGTVMALKHRTAPAHGVQFHPESVASEFGLALLCAFVELARNSA